MQVHHSSFAPADACSAPAGLAGGSGGGGGGLDSESTADAAEPPDDSPQRGGARSSPLTFLGLASRRRPSLASLRCRHSRGGSGPATPVPTLSTLSTPTTKEPPPALVLPPAMAMGVSGCKRPRSSTPPLPLQGILSPTLAMSAAAQPGEAPGLQRQDSMSSTASRPRKFVRFGSADGEVDPVPVAVAELVCEEEMEEVSATSVWMTYSSEVYDRRPIEPTDPGNSLSLPAREGQCSWIRCFEREKARNAIRLKALKAGLCPRASAGNVSKLSTLARTGVDTANARAIPIKVDEKDEKDSARALVLPVGDGESRTPSPSPSGSMSDSDGERAMLTPHPMGHWLPPTPPASDSDAGEAPQQQHVQVVWTEEPLPVEEEGHEVEMMEEREGLDVDVEEEEEGEEAEIQVDEDDEEENVEETEEPEQELEMPAAEDEAHDAIVVVEQDDSMPVDTVLASDAHEAVGEVGKSPKPSPKSSPRVSPRTSPMLAATVLANTPEPLAVDGAVAATHGKVKKPKNGMCALGKFTRNDLFSNCDALGGF